MKKIGKFPSRRFQQVKIFSSQILCLVVFANPNPFGKNCYLLLLFVRWFLSLHLIPYKHKFLALQ